MVTEFEKAKMRRIGRDLATGETHDRGTAAQRSAILAGINADRAHHGLPALSDRAPEEGLYERAQSLGMARIDR
jgi:hypothetical protein